MKPLFTVIGTPHYERLVKKLFRAHRDLPALRGRASEILSIDPYNVSREHHINPNPAVAGTPSASSCGADPQLSG